MTERAIDGTTKCPRCGETALAIVFDDVLTISCHECGYRFRARVTLEDETSEL